MVDILQMKHRPLAATIWSYLIQLRVLTSMQLARVRLSWRQYLVVSSAMPFGIVLLLKLMGVGDDPRMAAQVIAGNVVLSVAICSIVMLAQRVAWMKSSRVFDYYATLPVSRLLLLLALLFSYLVFALPGVALIIVLGGLLYGLPLHVGAGILPLLLLCGLSLASIGVLIGVSSPDEQLAGLISNLVMMFVLFMGIVPQDRLPGTIRYLAFAIPSTWAVDAMLGQISEVPSAVTVGLALLVLAAFTILSLFVIWRAMRWRA